MKIQLYTGPAGSGKTRRLRAAVADLPDAKVLDLTGATLRAVKRNLAYFWSPDMTIIVDEATADVHQFLHRSEHPGQAHVVLSARAECAA